MRPRLLILGLDGFRQDCLSEAHTPNLWKLKQRGAWSLSGQAGEYKKKQTTTEKKKKKNCLNANILHIRFFNMLLFVVCC